MKQRSIFVFLIVGLIVLLICVSCGDAQVVETTSTIMLTESITQTKTRNPTNTRTTKPSATAYFTKTIMDTPSTPYTPTSIPPTKVPPRDLLISYSMFGNDSCPYFIACLQGLNNYEFLLFSDGQLIIYFDEKYQTTTLSEYEVNTLISQIEKTGYFDLEMGDEMYKETPPEPAFVFTSGQRVSVMGIKHEIRVWQYDYLIDAIPDTISILSNYVPRNLEPYFPESVKIFVEVYKGFDSDRVYGEPNQEILYWPSESIPLGQFTKTEVRLPFKYIPFLEENLGYVPANQLVEQNEETYQVMICPILPEK